MKAITRRDFVTTSTRTAAVMVASASALSMPRSVHAKSANDKIILGLIGAGGRALSHVNGMLKVPNVEFKYICDVNAAKGAEHMRAAEQAQGYAPSRVVDMRELLDDKDVDAVIIATPEHWHALATVWACQAGKDVYVEKCPSIAIWDGRKAIEAARKYKRVVQVGFQNRSAPYALTAREYLQSGQLGQIVLVKVYNLLGGKPFAPQPDTVPPEGLDWDRWLGPAKDVPYNAGRHLRAGG